MKNNFDNLKKELDNTLFHDVYFDDNQYKKVLNSIASSKKNREFYPFKKRLNVIFSSSVICLLFTGIMYFIGIELNLFNGIHNKQANYIVKSKNELPNEDSKYIPAKQEENDKDMTKEEILTKMLNTVDNFETARGEYIIHYANIPSNATIEYTVSLKNHRGGFGIRTDIVNGEKTVSSEYFTKDALWLVSEQTKTYRELGYVENDNTGKELKLEDAFSKDSNGVNVTNYRESIPFGLANETLFPYEIASNYTRDLDTWEIEKQNEELLGHNTLVIKGEISRADFQSFRFWVDKDTGILVKYETYNEKEEVVDYLHPKKLEVNVPIDSEKFTPNLVGYVNEDESKQNLPRMKTGNIDELVPAQLKQPWEEAKNSSNETTILPFGDSVYIYPKKGYLVNYIEVNGNNGTLYLAKTSNQKSSGTFPALAEGYKVKNLKIVYEDE